MLVHMMGQRPQDFAAPTRTASQVSGLGAANPQAENALPLLIYAFRLQSADIWLCTKARLVQRNTVSRGTVRAR